MKKKFLFNIICNLFVVFFILGSNYNTNAQNILQVGIPIDFSDGNEYDPAFSNDGELLAFVSDKSGRFQLYLSKKSGKDSWSEPEAIIEINEFNGGKGNIRHPAFNYDASILYYSADFNKDSSDIDIFYSKRLNGNWSAPSNMGAPINSISYDGQPSISADDLTLYFVRNKTDNPGNSSSCKKIVYSQKLLNGDWTEPEELPVPINVDCEANPRIGLDNKTLYFSSTREGGKGGLDIYRTKLIAKNVWIPAESIDTMNTINNDYAPTFFFDNDVPYYAIEVVGKDKVSSSLYKLSLLPQYLVGKNIKVSGKIIELSSQQPIDAILNVYDPVTSRLISKYSNNPKTGEYQLFLPFGNNYQIDFSKADYSHTFINFEAANIKKNEEIVKDITLYKDVKLILNVFDEEIFKPINATIVIRNSKNETINPIIEKIDNGRYLINIPLNDEYQFTITAEYFETLGFAFDLKGIVQFDEFEKDAELKVKKVDFEIAISDEETQTGLPVEVIITNLESNEVIRTTATADSDGKYIIKLRDGDSYNVSVSPKGYSFYNTTVNLKKKDAPKKLDVKLKQLKEDTKLTLNSITFESNSAELKESSYSELDRVVKLMTDNPDIKIEISAHTDNAGSDAYNLRLSKRRANSVMTYMLEKKIPTSRMVSQGYGESKPIYANDTDENKAMNRRVELKIVKIQ